MWGIDKALLTAFQQNSANLVDLIINGQDLYIGNPQHAYQSLACETAINTDFSELFSLKRIYIKYKNAILSLIGGFFRT